jgi:hypothetical protein
VTAWPEITDAVTVAQSGDPDEGRRRLLACWQGTAEADHAQRCVVAHYLADLQDDLDEELAWDERALEALPHVTDDDLRPLGLSSAAGLAPSLHLNLGDGYLRRGDVDRARHHLEQGMAAVDVLADDAYGTMVRGGFERLAARIETPDALPRRRRP